MCTEDDKQLDSDGSDEEDSDTPGGVRIFIVCILI